MAKAKAARKRPSQTIVKRQTNDEKIIGATVTTSERGANRYKQNDAKDLARRVQQMVLFCIMFNATNCSGQKMRLFRKSGSAGSRAWKGRPVTDKKRNAFMRNPIRGFGPGFKAAQHAMDSEGIEEVVDAPMLDLLNNANPWQRGTTFDKLCWLQTEAYGRDYVHVVAPKAQDPSELYVMYADKVRTVADDKLFIGGYMYGRDMSVEKFFPVDEVMRHVMCPHPFDPFGSLSPLHSVFTEADLYAASNESATAMYRNGARPDFGVKVGKETTDIQMKQMREHIEQRHRGPSRRGEFFIFRDSDFVPLHFTNAEMEDLASRQDLKDCISGAYGIPNVFYKMTDATLAGVEKAQEYYARFTMTPRLAQRAEEWTETLLPWYGINPGEYWFAYDDCVPENKELVMKETQMLSSTRAITRNEIRERHGYKPMDGLDEFEEVQKPGSKPGDDPKSDKPKEDPKEDKKAVEHTHVEVKDDRASTLQTEMEDIVRRWINNIGNTLPPMESPGVVDLSAQTKVLHTALKKPVGGMLMNGVRQGAAEVSKPVVDPLSLFPDHAVKFIDGYTFDLAEGISDTTADHLKIIVRDGLARGESYAQIATTMRAQMTEESQWRASMIARTEVMRANNYGKLEAWKYHAIPGVRLKLSSGACPACVAFVKTFGFDRPIGTPFAEQGATYKDELGNEIVLDYETVYAPPIHPNCRCFIEPILSAEEIRTHKEEGPDIGLEEESP